MRGRLIHGPIGSGIARDGSLRTPVYFVSKTCTIQSPPKLFFAVCLSISVLEEERCIFLLRRLLFVVCRNGCAFIPRVVLGRYVVPVEIQWVRCQLPQFAEAIVEVEQPG